jgi:uncharacterized protein
MQADKNKMRTKYNSEKKIIIDSGALKLEGLFNTVSTDKGVVVAHPHPLYGGDMHNNVVESLCSAYNECGISSLRFNFRGIGLSEGTYDNGVGEQNDIEAAINFLTNEGITEIDLAGYSFGSWAIALGIKKFANINNVIMVSPPVDIFDYSSAYGSLAVKLVIAGSEDSIADWRSIEKALPLFNQDVTFKVIQGADHLYWNRSDDIKNIVMEFLENHPEN